jgi:hypothetical protein
MDKQSSCDDEGAGVDAVIEEMLSSTENYRKMVDKWCIKATDDDYRRWDYDHSFVKDNTKP